MTASNKPWLPEVELNRDPNARPAEGDLAGWSRFYAGAFFETPNDFDNAPWGTGTWRYDGGCQSSHLQSVADKLDRLSGIGLRKSVAIDVGGEPYLRDAKGSLVPVASVKAADLLMDEVVRSILIEARAVSTTIADFKSAVFGAVADLQALIAQNYGATLGGKKGNITLVSFDGCQKVQVQVADLLEFGPELQAAKQLIDECLTEWAVGSAVELRALVNRVFQVDKEGQINRAELFMLLRVEIADERWISAMDAIRDSIRVIGSRTYVRFYERPAPDAAWRAVTIDLAAA